MRELAPVLMLIFLLGGCGENKTGDALNREDVQLPGGQVIHAETALTQADMARGLMFRESLAADRGMLFAYPQPGLFPFWMYHTLIPLDMIWMDRGHRIVEIVANAPPCRTEASACPQLGGTQTAQYILEIKGGMAVKYGLKKGDQLRF